MPLEIRLQETGDTVSLIINRLDKPTEFIIFTAFDDTLGADQLRRSSLRLADYLDASFCHTHQ